MRITTLGIISLLSVSAFIRLTPAAKAQESGACFMVNSTGTIVDLSHICGFSPAVEPQVQNEAKTPETESKDSQLPEPQTDEEKLSRARRQAIAAPYSSDSTSELENRTPASLRRLPGVPKYQRNRLRRSMVREKYSSSTPEEIE